MVRNKLAKNFDPQITDSTVHYLKGELIVGVIFLNILILAFFFGRVDLFKVHSDVLFCFYL